MANKNPFFSVVMPVYNVEKYLHIAAQSILNQTFTDFELILVDDCSPDNSPAMCDDIAANDARVVVIHKPQNEGLGFARNTGIDAAKGEYIIFVDSDDTLEATTLENCYKKLSKKTDILVFGIKMCFENSRGDNIRVENLMPQDFYADTKKDMSEMFRRLSEARVFQYACNKAYSRKFLNSVNIKFEKTKLIEDFLFNIAVFGVAESVLSINEAYYLYRKPTHETLASKYSPEFFELAKRKFLLETEFLKNNDTYFEPFLQQIDKGYIKHFISAVIRNSSRSANLSSAQQKASVLLMIDDEVTKCVLNRFHTNDIVMKLVVNLMKKRNAYGIILFCRFADFTRQKVLPLLKK